MESEITIPKNGNIVNPIPETSENGKFPDMTITLFEVQRLRLALKQIRKAMDYSGQDPNNAGGSITIAHAAIRHILWVAGY